MSSKSNRQGRAYEFAWIHALHETLSKVRKTKIVINSSYEANKNAWSSISEELQRTFKVSAYSAVETILALEPLMGEDNDELCLEFQADKTGEKGDVRDIVISREKVQWEVGLSIKHNHNAVKHSRLSSNIDFGKEWFGVACSETYWESVKPIFADLDDKKKECKLWSDIEDKEGKVYAPLLQAFIDEISRATIFDCDVPKKMIEYLLGTKDYYKIISRDEKKMTLVRSFNVHETLNKPSKLRTSTITVPIVELPTELVKLKFKKNSATTVEMYMNNGWQLSFRIHNASSKVESSLKFDIQLVGMPVSILTFECCWNDCVINKK